MSKSTLVLRSLAIVILAACLILAGCATSPIAILEITITAVEAALPLIGPTAGVDPATLAVVSAYLGAVSSAISQASDILASGATAAEKAAEITQAFAGLAVPLVPPQDQALVSAVQKVAACVAELLTSTVASTPKSSMAAARAVRPLSASDRQKLTDIKARATAVRLKLAGK